MEDTCHLPKVKKIQLTDNLHCHSKTHAELTYYITNRLAQISCNRVQLEHDSIVYTRVQGRGEGELEICNLHFPFVSVITINKSNTHCWKIVYLLFEFQFHYLSIAMIYFPFTNVDTNSANCAMNLMSPI